MIHVKEKAIKLMLNSELLGFKLRFAFIPVTIFLILSKAIKKTIVMKNLLRGKNGWTTKM